MNKKNNIALGATYGQRAVQLLSVTLVLVYLCYTFNIERISVQSYFRCCMKNSTRTQNNCDRKP